MTLHAALFSDPRVDALLSDEAHVQAMLDVEAALAEAEAEAGVIPERAAAIIRSAADVRHLDLQALARDAAAAGNIAIPLVKQLTALVWQMDAAAADHVHVGATSQDIIDTATVRQLRAATPIVVDHVRRAADAAARLARRHRATTMAGRTWLQQATPVTFGLKAAGWMAALDRGAAAVDERAATSLVLQFGGASGTLAALGAHAPAITTALGTRLELPVPAAPWHSHRDALVRFACAVGVLVGSLGKIGKDLALLAQTEVAEVSAPAAAGGGRSSSMPHKRNPVASAVALAASLRVPGLVATMLSGMTQEHERGLGGWQAEWDTLPEIVRLASGAASSIANALETLVVDEQRIRDNIAMTRGLTLAEAVVGQLAPHVGRGEARAIVDAASERALADGRPFADVLAADTRVRDVLDAAAIRACLDPDRYLGQAAAFVDAMLAQRTGGSDA